jgi:two-component system cell cycle sensor histidine kinase/response regulator CckA
MSLQPCDRSNENSGRRTILLVEDEPFVREATCSILERAGFKVLPAEDAQEAMEVYQQKERNVDLLMTDMVLPGKNGDELGREMRMQSPQVAVLVTSGYGEAAYETESPETKTYFLAKPYSRRSLVEKIEAILGDMKALAAHAG